MVTFYATSINLIFAQILFYAKHLQLHKKFHVQDLLDIQYVENKIDKSFLLSLQKLSEVGIYYAKYSGDGNGCLGKNLK